MRKAALTVASGGLIIQGRRSHPIGAGGVMTPTFRGKGERGGHNLGIIIIFIYHILLLSCLYTNVNALSSSSWRVAHHAVNYFPTGGL